MSGEARPIRVIGDPVLARRCRPVTSFDEELARLIDDMFASMYAAEGVGLAANQIGVNLRVFVFDCEDAAGARRLGHLVNPVLEELPPTERELDDSDEGCLSVPGQWAKLARPDRAVAHGVDQTGVPLTLDGTGLFARCLQHEVDHLNGLLYVDRLNKRVRRRVLRALHRDLAEMPTAETTH